MTPEDTELAEKLRALGLSDAKIGMVMPRRVTRQYVHHILGPKGFDNMLHLTGAPALDRKVFAARLKAWRTARDLSQGGAADALRVSRGALAQWEQGVHGCALAATVMLLLDALDALDKIDRTSEKPLDNPI